MKLKKNNQNIQSALIVCRPKLRGFFYSRFFDFFFNMAVNILFPRKNPLWIGTLHSSLGQSALIMLTYSTLEMRRRKQEDRERAVLDGLQLSKKIGTKKTAFAGLLPSLLNHFQSLSLKEWQDYKGQISTGQSMTCVGMGAVFEELLKNTRCRILSVVGLGAIGSSSLILLLEKIMRPDKIILCDRLKRKNKLKEWAGEIQKTYSVPVESVHYEEENFIKVYEGDMILGAVSRPNILNPDFLQTGCILVDDSFPPILSVKKAIHRMKNKKDVLILSGGKMKPASYHWTSESRLIPSFLISLFSKQIGAEGIPGCWLEALTAGPADKGKGWDVSTDRQTETLKRANKEDGLDNPTGEKSDSFLSFSPQSPGATPPGKGSFAVRASAKTNEKREETNKIDRAKIDEMELRDELGSANRNETELTNKFGSVDINKMKIIDTQKENLLKAYKLKDSLNLTLPDLHFFKYQIPQKLITAVFRLRKKNPH